MRPPWLGVAAAALAAGLGLSAVIAAVPNATGQRAFASDFTQDWLAARASARGEDPYQPTDRLFRAEFGAEEPLFEERSQPAPHPPILITAYRPLAALRFTTARVLWLALSAISIAMAAGVVLRSVGLRPAVAALAGIGALAIPVVQKEIAYGQTNGVLLGLLVLGWWALRTGRARGAGIALGTAAAFKLFPLLLLLPVWRMRERRAAGSMLAAFAVLSISGAAAVGFDRAWTFVTEISPENGAYWAGAPMNLSLVGAARRWLSDTAWVDGVHLPALAAIVAGVAFLTLVALAARTPARLSGDIFWAVVPLMLLASPLAWEFSLTLLVPLAVLIVARGPTPPRAIVMVALALCALGIPPGVPAPSEVGVAGQILGYSLPTIGLLALVWADLRARPEVVGTR